MKYLLPYERDDVYGGTGRKSITSNYVVADVYTSGLGIWYHTYSLTPFYKKESAKIDLDKYLISKGYIFVSHERAKKLES
jgi:hypothetical protein